VSAVPEGETGAKWRDFPAAAAWAAIASASSDPSQTMTVACGSSSVTLGAANDVDDDRR
jgi:hypothetical protein